MEDAETGLSTRASGMKGERGGQREEVGGEIDHEEEDLSFETREVEITPRVQAGAPEWGTGQRRGPGGEGQLPRLTPPVLQP